MSSFQVHFADHDILTAGDAPDVLVAMNPAALRANLGDLHKGATIIVDTHDFTARNLTKAGYTENPLDGDALDQYALHTVDLTGMTVEAVKEFGLSRKDASRAKNMFALGLLSLRERPEHTDRHDRHAGQGKGVEGVLRRGCRRRAGCRCSPPWPGCAR